MVRCVLSTGSHLYSLWVLPTLAPHHELHRQLVDNGKLASIYAGHGDIIHAVLGVAMLGLAYALVRTGRGQRVVAVFLTLAAASEFIGFPFGLALIAATCVWLGVRLLRGGDVLVPLRSS